MVKDIARTKWLIHSYFGSEYLPDWSPAAKASGDGTPGRESSIAYFGLIVILNPLKIGIPQVVSTMGDTGG